jgi:DNA-binding GntR family transcriptional regulator
MAATLVHHEPGWRLPRLTATARRYNVSAAEVDAAIDELVARHLLRRLPDGHVYRASPAEYRVPLEGLAGLTSYVDPMGGQLVCRRRRVSHRRPPEDIGRSLGLEAGDAVLAVRCVWTVGGEPAALSASYLPERLGPVWPELETPPFAPPGKGAALDDRPAGGASRHENGTPGESDSAPGESGSAPGEARVTGDGAPTATAGRARALQIELTPPPSSVARSLRLAAGELVATVTVSFEDPESRRPVAITTAMLRPDLFRIVIQATGAPAPAGRVDGFASVWTHATAGWEP